MSNVISLKASDLTPNTRVIYVRIKNVYSSELFYPACADSKIFAEIIGQKTLTPTDLKRIKSLGYSVALASPSLPEGI